MNGIEIIFPEIPGEQFMVSILIFMVISLGNA